MRIRSAMEGSSADPVSALVLGCDQSRFMAQFDHFCYARARTSRRRRFLHDANRRRILQTHSDVHAQRSAKPAACGVGVALLNVGLAGSFVTILLRSPWKLGCSSSPRLRFTVELVAILRAETSLGGLGNQIFSHGHHANVAIVRARRRSLLAGSAAQRIHGQLETFTVSSTHRRRDVRHHRMLTKSFRFRLVRITVIAAPGRPRSRRCIRRDCRRQVTGLSGWPRCDVRVNWFIERNRRAFGLRLLAVSVTTLVLNVGMVLTHSSDPGSSRSHFRQPFSNPLTTSQINEAAIRNPAPGG